MARTRGETQAVWLQGPCYHTPSPAGTPPAQLHADPQGRQSLLLLLREP